MVAISYGHASPLVPDDQERRDAVSRVLAANGDLDEMRALLERYQASAVVLVHSRDLGGAVLSSEAWQYWVDTLDAAGSEFTLRFREETPNRRAAVYVWQPG